MKKLNLKSVMTVIVVLFSIDSKAYDVEIDGIYYNLDKEAQTAIVTSGESKYSGDITIPTSVESKNNTYNVTSIGFSAFHGCSNLTSVNIPDCVTSIGENAFYNCKKLVSINIPENITSVGYCAFNNTAWYNKQSDGITYIGKVAYNYKGIMPENTTIAIKEGTISISEKAFYGCRNLASVEIPNSVTSIGKSAFQNCSSLTFISVPNSVTDIGDWAFAGTAWYDNQPDGLIYVGRQAYMYKGVMPENTDITIKEGTLSIGRGCFSSCDGLKSINLPNSVTTIGEEAFMWCQSLTSITIPSSVTQIGKGAFGGCNGLLFVNITDLSSWFNISIYPSQLGFPSTANPLRNAHHLYLNGEEVKDLVIPNGVAIDMYHFYGCNGLKSIEIPNDVTSIGMYAFCGCTELESVKVHWNRPLAGGADFFDENTKKNAPLYVPKGTSTMYMSAPGWMEFVNIVEYEDGEDAHYITIRMGDGGVLKQSVEVGQTYTYAVSADEGWEVNTLTFDGKDMTSLLMDGQFSTPVITSSAELNVVFKQIDTNVKEMPSMSDVKVYASNKSITVTGAEENEQVLVYGINGLPVASAVGNTSFSLESGVYIVKVGEETFKVRL